MCQILDRWVASSRDVCEIEQNYVWVTQQVHNLHKSGRKEFVCLPSVESCLFCVSEYIIL